MKSSSAFIFYLIYFFTCFGAASQVVHQQTSIELGERCPDLEIRDVTADSVIKNVRIRDFQGQHLILDFWTIGCLSCIESFPKLNKLQKRFGEQLKILLIGQDHLKKEGVATAKLVYEKYRQRWGLDLLTAFDSDLFKQLSVPLVPFVVWIDNRGIVKAITTSAEVNDENIESFLQGNNFEFVDRTKETVSSFDYRQPLLINNNGGRDSEFLYRSILVQGKIRGTKYTQPFICSSYKYYAGMERNRVQMVGVTLLELYDLAYGDSISRRPATYDSRPAYKAVFARSSYETYWPRPILELVDSSEFLANWKTGENIYSYSLIVPLNKATTQHLRDVMKRDLRNYFGYDVKVENRRMPCWFLTASDSLKNALETKGGNHIIEKNPLKLTLSNVPIYQLIREIWSFNSKEPPIVNQTEIEFYIDLELNAMMTDMNDIRQGLNRYGLDLKRGEKDMKVIIIREKDEIEIEN